MNLRSAACALTLLLASPAFGQSAAALQKIAPWVLEKTAGGQTAEYMVVLAEQADLSPARTLETKQAKGRFVYDTLFQHAQRTQAPLLAELRARGVEHRSYYIVNFIWVKGGQALAFELAERADVARIDPNPSVRGNLGQPDGPADESGGRADAPLLVEEGIGYTRAPQVWALTFTGQNIVVGGMDTGIRWTHNALRPHYRGWNGATADHNFNWHDSIHSGGGSCGFDTTAPCDDNGHGTHTVGTAVGDDLAGNQVGMAPGAKWIGCRNMNVGAGTPTTYLECFEWMLAPYPIGQGPAQGNPAMAPDVTVNSWGCPTSEGCDSGNWATMQTAIANHRTAGILTEASAGNAGSSCSTVNDPPGMFDESYSVAALSCAGNVCTDALASFSSRGPVTVDASNRVKPDIAAPGTSVRSATNSSDTAYASLQGTSMSGPHVAGAVALLLSGVPALSGNVTAIENRLSQQAIRNATTSTASCSSTAGVYPNNLYGFGRLDVLCAVQALTNVSIGVAGSTTIGGASPCLGGTATVTDTGGASNAHQWGYRSTPGGAITNLAGQTGSSYQLNCANFPSIGTFFLVEVTTPAGCNAVVSNEITVTVNATPVELQTFGIE